MNYVLKQQRAFVSLQDKRDKSVCWLGVDQLLHQIPDFQLSLGNLSPQIFMFVPQGLRSALQLLEETP